MHCAHRVANRFPDGQLDVNLRGFASCGSAMPPAEAVRALVDGLAVPAERIPASLDAQVGLYRSLLSGRRMLIMLDNARDPDQVRPLLPNAPGCLVVITNRNALTSLVAVEGAHPLALDLLPADEARQLLARRLGAERLAAEPQALKDIIARCAGLPLAMAIVAARAAAHPDFPLHVLAWQLGDSRNSLDPLTDEDPSMDLWAVFSWSYDKISGEPARLFRLLSLHPGPDISTAAAASLAGIPPDRVRGLLTALARAHLVAERTPGRYGFHDLLRGYATELVHRLDSEEERRVAFLRVLDHYLHTAQAAALHLTPNATRSPTRTTARGNT